MLRLLRLNGLRAASISRSRFDRMLISTNRFVMVRCLSTTSAASVDTKATKSDNHSTEEGSLNTVDLSQFMASLGSAGETEAAPNKRNLKAAAARMAAAAKESKADNNDAASGTESVAAADGVASDGVFDQWSREARSGTVNDESDHILFKPFTKPRIAGAVHLSGSMQFSTLTYPSHPPIASFDR